MNSVVVVVCTVAGIVFLSLLASYVIVRSRTGLAVFSNQLFLLGIAIPIQATIIPIYLIIVQLGLYDTLTAADPARHRLGDPDHGPDPDQLHAGHPRTSSTSP